MVSFSLGNSPLCPETKLTHTHTQLLPSLATASITKHSISHSISFTGFSLIYNMDKKQAILMVLDSLLADKIKSIIRVIPLTSPSQPAPIHLHTHPQLPKINLTPITDFPCYCLIGSCPFHNKKCDLFTITSTGLQQAQSHNIHIHHHLLSTLTTSTLSSIRWHQCCDTCHAIYLNRSHLDTHCARCIAYHTFLTSFTASTTTTAHHHKLAPSHPSTSYVLIVTSKTLTTSSSTRLLPPP